MKPHTLEDVVQGWVWRELEQYKTRICDIGVDGHALYNLEGLTGLHLIHRCLQNHRPQTLRIGFP